MVSIGGDFSQTFSFSLLMVASLVPLSPTLVKAMPSLLAPRIWKRLWGSCFQFRSMLYASMVVFGHQLVFCIKSFSRFSRSLPYRLQSAPRMKVQAKYCSLAYFLAAFNTSGLPVALVTGNACSGKHSFNQSGVSTEVSTTVFDDFDTVLELLEVCLTGHGPLLGQ